MKIKMTTPYLLQYRTSEVILLMEVVVNIYKKVETLPETLHKKLEALEFEWNRLRKEYRHGRGHELTKKVEKLDKERKGKIKAIRWFLESQLYRESEVKVQAAKILLARYRKICNHIERKNYHESTALISILTQNWMQVPRYSSAVETLGITAWVENVFQVNEDFFNCIGERTISQEKKGNCYPIKLRVKALYEDLIDSTQAFVYISQGDHSYQYILETVNKSVKKINTSYNIRQGIRKSKKNKV